MSDRLPPLTALRAFEAAARHMSFALAAAELHVTPAALSYQIKSLEQHLGASLFHRLNRAVELTEAGMALRPGVAQGFDALSAAWGEARRTLEAPVMTVTAGPAFMTAFLVPRLRDFAEAVPDIDLRLSASLSVQDLERDGIDIALRFGPGWQSEGEPLLQEVWTPLASPGLAAKIICPADLLDLPLLQQVDDFVTPPPDWSSFFNGLRLPAPLPPRTRFDLPQHALAAAAAGNGVVLGRVSLAEQEIRSGRLVMPLRDSLRRDAGYRALLRRPDCTRTRGVLDWIKSEMTAIAALTADRLFVEP